MHSQYSDGAGSMSKGFEFGRDVMDLDVVAYTDHDTMGVCIPPTLQRRRMERSYFEDMNSVTQRCHDPGEFVTLLGYEWMKQPDKGGRVTVYFEGVDDDEMAPLVEVYPRWGSGEPPTAESNEKPVEMGQGEMSEPGHFVQDAHELGYRVGTLWPSDFHAPRPGRSNIHLPAHLPSLSDIWADGVGWGHIWRAWEEGSYPGGLTGFYAPNLAREGVCESLRSRRVYATTQPDRILVEFAVDGTAVSEDDSAVTADGPRTVSFRVAGTTPLARLTVVRNNEPWHVAEGTDDASAGFDADTLSGEATDDGPVAGMAWDGERGSAADVFYLRAEQADGGEGFAVVADEIKELAEETKEAAGDIEDRIGRIHRQASETVETMESTSRRVTDGTTTVQEAVDALDRIVEYTEEADDATEQQARTAREVIETIDALTAISQQTATEADTVAGAADDQSQSIDRVSASAADLRTRAEELKAVLSIFRTRADTEATGTTAPAATDD